MKDAGPLSSDSTDADQAHEQSRAIVIRTRTQHIVLNIVTVVVGIPTMFLTIGLLTRQHSTLLQWVVADIAGVLAMGLSTWLTMVLGTCIESIVIRCVGRRRESTEGGEELRDRL